MCPRNQSQGVARNKFVQTLSCALIIAPNTTELLCDIHTRGPQHVVEEGCGVRVWVARPHQHYHHGSDNRMHD
jgi:hypothetical protein